MSKAGRPRLGHFVTVGGVHHVRAGVAVACVHIILLHLRGVFVPSRAVALAPFTFWYVCVVSVFVRVPVGSFFASVRVFPCVAWHAALVCRSRVLTRSTVEGWRDNIPKYIGL